MLLLIVNDYKISKQSNEMLGHNYFLLELQMFKPFLHLLEFLGIFAGQFSQLRAFTRWTTT